MIRLLLLLVWPLTLLADQTITLGSGISMPPYVIADKDRGIAVDVFRAAMAEENIQVVLRYGGNVEVAQAFTDKRVDAVFVGKREQFPAAYFSALPLIVFHNQAITLRADNYTIDTVEALQPYRLGAFRLATQLMPEPYPEVVAAITDYREYTLQVEQVQDLFRRERQVLVMDRTIFRYFLSQLRRQNPASELYRQEQQYHDIFARSQYYAVFHSEMLRDSFDRGFQKIRDNGRYERILTVYQALLSDYLFR